MIHKKYIKRAFARNIRADLLGSVLTFSMLDEQQQNAYSLDLNDTLAKMSQDHGVIAIGHKDGKAFAVETTAISLGLRGMALVNTDGLARKDTPLGAYRFIVDAGAIPICYMMTPHKGCSLSDVTFYWFFSEGQNDITVNGEPLQAEEVPLMPIFLASWCPVFIEAPQTAAANGRVTFNVRAPAGTEIFLEATAGSLNRMRASDGDTVVLFTDGLTSGDKVRIKAGYKFWPSKTEAVIDITEQEAAQ